MDRKTLSPIHRELIQLRNLRLQEAVNAARQRDAELRNTLELIAKELGADLAKETWTVSDDGMFLERVEAKEGGV
jgi:DhnA family fructose-bisphosphate aldolase class Ia